MIEITLKVFILVNVIGISLVILLTWIALYFDGIIDFLGLGKLADRWEERLRLKYMKEKEQ